MSTHRHKRVRVMRGILNRTIAEHIHFKGSNSNRCLRFMYETINLVIISRYIYVFLVAVLVSRRITHKYPNVNISGVFIVGGGRFPPSPRHFF